MFYLELEWSNSQEDTEINNLHKNIDVREKVNLRTFLEIKIKFFERKFMRERS